MTLEELLAEERKRYLQMGIAIQSLVPEQFQKPFLSASAEEDVELHMSACRRYYEQNGTKRGYLSPWIEVYNKPGHWSYGE